MMKRLLTMIIMMVPVISSCNHGGEVIQSNEKELDQILWEKNARDVIRVVVCVDTSHRKYEEKDISDNLLFNLLGDGGFRWAVPEGGKFVQLYASGADSRMVYFVYDMQTEESTRKVFTEDSHSISKVMQRDFPNVRVLMRCKSVCKEIFEGDLVKK